MSSERAIRAAKAWFAPGGRSYTTEEAVRVLAEIIDCEAIRAAEREAAEKMRERCAEWLDENAWCSAADGIRALEVEP